MPEETSPNKPSSDNRSSPNDVLERSSPALNLEPPVSAENFFSLYGNVKWTPTTSAYFSWPEPEITQGSPLNNWPINMTSPGQPYSYPAYVSSRRSALLSVDLTFIDTKTAWQNSPCGFLLSSSVTLIAEYDTSKRSFWLRAEKSSWSARLRAERSS